MSLFFLRHPAETDMALFAGGEAGLPLRWRIEKHLYHCDSCREAVADFFHLQSDLRQLADIPQLDWEILNQNVRVALTEQVQTSTTAASEPKNSALKIFFWRRLVWGFSLASVVVVFGFIAFQQLSRQVGSKVLVLSNAPIQQSDAKAKTNKKSVDMPRDSLSISEGARKSKNDAIKIKENTTQLAKARGDDASLEGSNTSFALSKGPEISRERGRRFWQPNVPLDSDTRKQYSSLDIAARYVDFSPVPDGLHHEEAEIGIAADGSMSIRTFDYLTNTVTITHVYLP